jgi:hypothetical protein
MLLFDLAKYFWLHLKISLHNAVIWNAPRSKQENDEMIQSRYPLEWQELQAIRNKWAQRVKGRKG